MKRITIEIDRDSDLIPVMDFLGQSIHSATAHRYNVAIGERIAARVRIEPDALRKEPSPACTHPVTQSGHGGRVCALCGATVNDVYEYEAENPEPRHVSEYEQRMDDYGLSERMFH